MTRIQCTIYVANKKNQNMFRTEWQNSNLNKEWWMFGAKYLSKFVMNMPVWLSTEYKLNDCNDEHKFWVFDIKCPTDVSIGRSIFIHCDLVSCLFNETNAKLQPIYFHFMKICETNIPNNPSKMLCKHYKWMRLG